VAKFEVIVLVLIVLEPFLFGTTICFAVQTPWGVLNAYWEGVMLGVLLGLRMLFLVTLFIVTLSHMSLSEFVGALRTLHVPTAVLGSLLIMLRYIPLFMSERTRMQEALSLRGLERGARSSRVSSLGYTVGSTIDRAFGRSRAVYESMTLRGFGRGMVMKNAGFRRGDMCLAVLVTLVLLGLWFGLPWLFEAMQV
jgi:energy-coupling factor transporter transmembrane protein EcfT